jgi:streptogramin lyase
VISGITGPPPTAVNGFVDGTLATAQYDQPFGVAVDPAGNVYVADVENNAIRKIDTAGNVTTLAGLGPLMEGFADGDASTALFFSPRGVAVDSTGNVYVADGNNQAIRKIDTAGNTTTIANTAGAVGFVDGDPATARFFNPVGLAVDAAGNVYVCDQQNHAIRKIDPAGNTTTIANTSGTFGFADGDAATARFSQPSGLCLDGSGNIYVADTANDAIRKIDSSGMTTTLLGGVQGFVDGAATAARFDSPSGIAIDAAGNLYVSDYRNDAVRWIDPALNTTTIGGAGGPPPLNVPGFSGGDAATSKFAGTGGLAVDSQGRIWVVDALNHAIYRYEP